MVLNQLNAKHTAKTLCCLIDLKLYYFQKTYYVKKKISINFTIWFYFIINKNKNIIFEQHNYYKNGLKKIYRLSSEVGEF